MNKENFYRFIEQGAVQGACRYSEYWFIYNNLPKNQSRVLELGAGTSVLSLAIAKDGHDVTVTEIDKVNIEFQEKIIMDNPDLKYRVVKVDGPILPFEDKIFDVAILASAIEHFNNDVEVVKEISRALDSEGLLIVTLPVGKKYIENRHEGMNHPPERVYDVNSFDNLFLKDFDIVTQEFYKWSEKDPKDFLPHLGWSRKRINFNQVKSFNKADWLCVVLKKK